MTGVQLIKSFFDTPERPLGFPELKALTPEDKKELAEAIAAQRGLKWDEASKQYV